MDSSFKFLDDVNGGEKFLKNNAQKLQESDNYNLQIKYNNRSEERERDREKKKKRSKIAVQSPIWKDQGGKLER